MELVVIEEHGEDGVIVWGVSTEGPNPEEGDFVVCRDRRHAFAVKEAHGRGDTAPLMAAIGAMLRAVPDDARAAGEEQADG